MSDNICNVDPEFRRDLITSTIITHSFLPVAFWFYALTIGQVLPEIYTSSGLTLPNFTQIINFLSSLVIRFWYLYFLILGVALTLDGLLFSLLWRSRKKDTILLWPMGILFLQVSLGMIYVFGMALLYRNQYPAYRNYII